MSDVKHILPWLRQTDPAPILATPDTDPNVIYLMDENARLRQIVDRLTAELTEANAELAAIRAAVKG